jgi:hypothetical protein
VGNPVFIDEHIGPDYLGTGISQPVHQHRIALSVHIFHDAEDATFRVDGAYAAVFVDPHLGQVVAHKMVARHGRGGFSASGRRGTGHPGHPATGTVNAGDEHVFGQFSAVAFIDSLVYGKAVVPFFQQQGVARIRAVKRIGRAMAAVHENPCIGQIFGPIKAPRCECWCKNVPVG